MTEIPRLETHPSSQRPQTIDDLKLVRGIGPAIERRLNAIGIFTFARLAGSRLEDLAVLFADVPGHSIERLAEKDWIGQARALQAETHPQRVPDEPLPALSADAYPQPVLEEPENDDLDFSTRQRYASFTVELLVDADRNIRRTRIVNNQERQKDSWAGWDSERLMTFFAESGDLHLSGKISTADAEVQEEAEPEQLKPEAPPRRASGTLSVNAAALIPAGDNRPTWTLLAGRPFRFHLDLELTDAEISAETVAEYTVSVDAKHVGTGEIIHLGRVNGSLTASPRFEVDVDVAGLSAGFYRPDAFVWLTLHDGDPSQRKTIRAVREGHAFIVS